jgi:hypothetical protein
MGLDERRADVEMNLNLNLTLNRNPNLVIKGDEIKSKITIKIKNKAK